MSEPQPLWDLPPLDALPDGAHVLVFSETQTGRAPAELIIPDLSGKQNRSDVLDSLVSESMLFDQNGVQSIDFHRRQLYSPGGITMLNWDYGYMTDESERMSIDWYFRQLRSYSDAVSLDWENRQLSDRNSNPSVNWEWRSLLLPDDTAVLNWGLMELLDHNYTLSVGWWSRNLVDKSYNTSVNWEARQLYDYNSYPSLNWNERMLYDSNQNWSLDWENQQLIGLGGLAATVDWGLCELNNDQGKVLSWNSGIQMSVDASWSANTGPVLRSPDGKKWRIQVSNTGALSTVQTY